MTKVLFYCHGRKCWLKKIFLFYVDSDMIRIIFTTGLQLLKDVPMWYKYMDWRSQWITKICCGEMSKLVAKKYTQLFGVWKLKSYYSNLGFDGGGKNDKNRDISNYSNENWQIINGYKWI